MSNDNSWPLFVYIGNSNHTAALMNRKAYNKSLEKQHPWITHPNGRILPWPGKPEIIYLNEKSGCYVLKIPEDSVLQPYGSPLPDNINPDERKPLEDTPETYSTSILSSLSTLIHDRRLSGTENSYTHHLFKEGSEKIRKKLGEEAIELILASRDADVIYESADLVYHLLVLLEALNLNWGNVLDELKRRFD